MTLSRLLLILGSFAWAAGATADPLLVSKTAEWANPEGVTTNVREECTLPTYQADAVREKLSALGISAAAAEGNEIPKKGQFLVVRLEGVMSQGNAFIGHGKQVTTSAKLYTNGAEVAHYTSTRSSMGGFGGNFKGSCAVLNRCAAATALDIAQWAQGVLADPSSAKP